MAEADRIKWNRKFREKPSLFKPRPPAAAVERFAPLAPGKEALDLACGGGRHALFLSERGFHVDAVDIASVALEKLAAETDPEKVTLIEADLDGWTPEKRYDLIVKTNYLDRPLIERAKAALSPGGIFIVETYMAHPENEKKDSNPDFLLQPGELKTFFTEGFEILEYREFPNESYELYRMRKQSVAVRKTA